MAPRLRLRPRAVLPTIYWRLREDLLAAAGDWVLIDVAAETITVMTDAEVREAFEVSGEATDPRPTDPAPAPANDTEDRGSTPEQEAEGESDSGEEEPDNGNGEDEGGV